MKQRDSHEFYGVFAGRLHWIAAIMAGTLVGIVALMYLLARTWLGPLPSAPAMGKVAGPPLQPNPGISLQRLRAREEALLHTYGWIDRQAGIARIPIERAMQMLTQQQQRHSAAPPPGARALQPRLARTTRVPPPADLYRRADIDQRLGAQVPVQLAFRDERQRPVTLRELAAGKPMVLAFGYLSCPNLCDLELHGLGLATASVALRPQEDYAVTFVSIDPDDTPADAHAKLESLAREQPSAHVERWHVLTGQQRQIETLTRSVGLRYFRDPRNGQYAHPAGIIVLTAGGQVAQYFFGVHYPAGALRLALISASHGQLGSVLDQLVLLCCGYDPSTGRYSLLIGRLMQILGIAFVLVAAGTMLWMSRRKRT